MSIASELSALNGYILGAYDEISDKGGTVPANKNMANLASAISSISSGTPTTITPLSVTENGTYTAPTGTAYSPVEVNVSGSAKIGQFNVISGEWTATTLTNRAPVMTYADFLQEAGGSKPAFVAMGIFDPYLYSARSSVGLAYEFGYATFDSTPHYRKGSITRGSMATLILTQTDGVVFQGYSNNDAGKFQGGRTYTWFILWKN